MAHMKNIALIAFMLLIAFSLHSTGAHIGLYQTTVDEMYTPYLIPQSCGNRTNVRWVTFTGSDSTGIGVFGLPSFEFSALNYSDRSLNKSKISELQKEQTIYLNIDYRQRGLGNASCGPGTIQQYNVPFISYDYDIQISPVNIKTASPFASKSALPYVQAPVVSPLITSISDTTPITIAHSDAKAQIYYTLDGSQPTQKSKLFAGAFTIDGSVKVRALAVKNNETSITEAVKDFDVAKVLLASQKVVIGQKAIYFEVSIKDIKQIRLIQGDADGNIGWDHADWADMKLIKADGTEKYLSDFRAIVSTNRYGPINYDKSVAGKTITIAGQTFERGNYLCIICFVYLCKCPNRQTRTNHSSKLAVQSSWEKRLAFGQSSGLCSYRFTRSWADPRSLLPRQ